MGKRELKYGGIQGLLLEWYNRILQVYNTEKKLNLIRGMVYLIFLF